MKRFIYALTLALALPSLWAAQHLDGNYVVTLVGNMSPDTVLRQHGLGAKQKWTHAIHGFSAPLTGNQADRLEQDTRVLYIEPDVTVSALGPSGISGIDVIDIAGPYYMISSWYSFALDSTTGLIPVIVDDFSSDAINFHYIDSHYISFVNYAAHTSSKVRIPYASVDPSWSPTSGAVCMRGTNLFTMSTVTNQMFVFHWAINGSPPTSLTFLDRWPMVAGTNRITSCLDLFATPDGGVLGSYYWPEFWHAPAPTERKIGLFYRNSSGTWTNIFPAMTITNNFGNEDFRARWCVHPGDGSIWGLYESTYNPQIIRRIRVVESGGLITWTTNQNFTTNFSATTIPDVEVPPLQMVPDPLRGKIVCAYGGNQRLVGGSLIYPPCLQSMDTNSTCTGYVYPVNSDPYYCGGVPMALGSYWFLAYLPYAFPAPVWTNLLCATFNGSTFTSGGVLLSNASVGGIVATIGVPGIIATQQTSPTEGGGTIKFFYPSSSVETVPTGVRRIGCLSNSVWRAGNVGVDVAVIDSGIDLTHPDLNVFANTTFVTGTTTGNDDYGHGTHVAGTIGARNNSVGVVGVAPGCRLWAVKVLDSGGNGPLSQVISGVDYVTQHAAEIEVANMSIGGQGSSDSLRLAIQNSIALGVVYVVSAGNSGFDVYGGDKILGTGDDFFPASYPEVLCVGAIGDSDGIEGGYGSASTYAVDDSYASFSNYAQSVDSSKLVYSYGRAVDVCAPGVNIYSTYKGGAYSTMSGTSMSCPHAAGAVALYIAANGRATTAAGTVAIRQAIVDRAIDWNHWGQWAWSAYETAFSRGRPPLIDVSDGAKPTNYPVVTMTSPFPGYVNTYQNNQSITCTATATDATDGDITAKIVWRVCGAVWSPPLWSKSLGTGGSITATVTNMVYNNLSAAVTNSAGHSTEVSALLYIISPSGAVAPTVAISSPVDGSIVAGTDVQTFTGTATDPVDGNIASKLYWTSSLDGYLGQGASFTNFLSAGAQTITAAVTNVAGLSGSHSHTITVTGTPPPPPPTNYPPVVTIQQPANGQSYPAGTSITCVGTASDVEDGDLSANITWSDSIAGGLGRGATVTYAPSAGTHAITAQISDSSGALDTDTHTITITSVGTPLTVTVTANKAAYRNKEKALITTTVLQAGVAVSGATVTVQIRSSSGRAVASKTGTTTSAGTFAFYLPIQKSKYGTGTGPWTATVTANASKTGYVSGVGTTTYLVYP